MEVRLGTDRWGFSVCAVLIYMKKKVCGGGHPASPPRLTPQRRATRSAAVSAHGAPGSMIAASSGAHLPAELEPGGRQCHAQHCRECREGLRAYGPTTMGPHSLSLFCAAPGGRRLGQRKLDGWWMVDGWILWILPEHAAAEEEEGSNSKLLESNDNPPRLRRGHLSWTTTHIPAIAMSHCAFAQ